MGDELDFWLHVEGGVISLSLVSVFDTGQCIISPICPENKRVN